MTAKAMEIVISVGVEGSERLNIEKVQALTAMHLSHVEPYRSRHAVPRGAPSNNQKHSEHSPIKAGPLKKRSTKKKDINKIVYVDSALKVLHVETNQTL